MKRKNHHPAPGHIAYRAGTLIPAAFISALLISGCAKQTPPTASFAPASLETAVSGEAGSVSAPATAAAGVSAAGNANATVPAEGTAAATDYAEGSAATTDYAEGTAATTASAEGTAAAAVSAAETSAIPGASFPTAPSPSGTDPSQTSNRNGEIDSNAALDVALGHAGLTEQDIRFQEVKTDIEHGQKVFEVELITSDGVEYDYELDPLGSILSFSFDAEALFQQPHEANAKTISEEQARQIVLNRVPGADAGNLVIRTERDDGRSEYEGKLIHDGMEYEFKLDACSGGLIEWEVKSFASFSAD